MDSMPIAMFLVDCEGGIRAVGAKTQEDFGYQSSDLVNHNVNVLMSSPHRERHDAYIARYLKTGERRMIGCPRIENALDNSGHAIAVEVNIGEVMLGDQRMFVGFLRPIESTVSNRQQLQNMLAELAHISRVSAMGALATAIAHELNQPLTTIANFAAGARDRLAAREDSGDLEEVIAAIDHCGNQALRAGQLLHRLREFIEPSAKDAEFVSVEKLVDDTISLALINGYRRSMVIDRDIPHDLPPVRIDAIQAEQVLYNLLRNAFEAMSEKHETQHHLELKAYRVGEHSVAISVEDSGPGVPPEMRQRIFQNFITTKPGGMGVGLSICRQIVESFGGTLELGEPGRLGGAKFVMTLPCGFPEADAGSE